MRNAGSKTKVKVVVILAIMLVVPGLLRAGNLEPTAPPGATMKTLDEIPPTWSQKLPADKRFVLVLDGEAVLDKETGLVWEKSLSTNTATAWLDADTHCCTKVVGGRKGWRLPTREELASLIDPTRSNPALSSGHPFVGVQSSAYWSATTFAALTDYAWRVNLNSGGLNNTNKSDYNLFWCVRGGNGYDGY